MEFKNLKNNVMRTYVYVYTSVRVCIIAFLHLLICDTIFIIILEEYLEIG